METFEAGKISFDRERTKLGVPAGNARLPAPDVEMDFLCAE